jgi:hypothetical protein
MAGSVWRKVERLSLGVVFGIAAWIIERRVLKAIKRKGGAAPTKPTPISESVSELERPAG